MLQRLERADRFAELLTRADVFGRGVSAVAHRSGGCARGQGHHDAAGPLGGNAGYLRAVRHDMVREFDDTHIGAQVGSKL